MHELYITGIIIHKIIVILTIVHVLMGNRLPAKTMAWVLVIYFVPVAGILLYIFFGIDTRKERLISARSLNQLGKRSMLNFVEQQALRLPEEHKQTIDLFIIKTCHCRSRTTKRTYTPTDTAFSRLCSLP